MVAATNCAHCPTTNPTTTCCQTNPQKQSTKLCRLEDICRIALAIFAIAVAPEAALVALTIGALAGASYHLYTKLTYGYAPEHGKGKPICAQGYMETLSGFTYRPEANLLATAVFIAVHISHYPPFYVPFTGVFVGIWSGAGIARAIVG